MGFLVNLLIALASAMIAIVPAIVGAAGNEVVLIKGRIYATIGLAASSVVFGVVTSGIRLLEFRAAYWALMEERKTWLGKTKLINQEWQEKARNVYATLFWPAFGIQAILWVAGAAALVLTLFGLVSTISSNVPTT